MEIRPNKVCDSESKVECVDAQAARCEVGNGYQVLSVRR